MPLDLDYYYGNEAEQYSFYRIPKVLLTDRRYRGVSVEAKVLYGLLLDRMSLSVRNGWLDNEGRVYIYFTQEDAMTLMSCGKDKATKLFRELDISGIGLIERRKQGQGKPTRIYVKNFTLPPDPEQSQPVPEPSPTASAQPPELPVPQTAEKPQSRPLDSTAVKTADFPQSAQRETRGQDSGKTAANNTENNKTEGNDTDSSIFPPTPSPPAGKRRSAPKRKVRKDEMDDYRELIRENIDYSDLLHDNPWDRETIDGYVELMVETCCTTLDSIRICGQEVDSEVVKSRLLKLNSEHILYVMSSLQENTTKIANIRAYTLSALYNAPVTMSQYYTSRVSHDMAHGLLNG